MSSRVIKDWADDASDTFIGRFGERLKTRGSSFKERLNATVYRLKAQQEKLEGATARIRSQDQKLFRKCVEAQVTKDRARAFMYANECAELRKIMKTTLSCHLALEQVTLRLETVRQFGDIAALMSPVASVVSSVKTQLSGVMPEVSYELGEIYESLDTLAVEFGETAGVSERSELASEEATSIIREASAVAEQQLKEKFPDLPSPQLQAEKKTLESLNSDA